MVENKGKFNKFNKVIFIILLSFFVLPLFGLVSLGNAEDSSHSTYRYVDNADRIFQFVSDNVNFLPKLNMLGTEVINNIVLKINNYGIFVDDYIQNVEIEGDVSFNDLMEGYRSTRKLVFLVEKINNLVASQQTAYELTNTVGNYLEEKRSEVSNYNVFKNSLSDQKDILDNNFDIAESLTLNIISTVDMDGSSYTEDINNLFFLRSQLKEIIDNHLEALSEIIDISENILESVNNSSSIFSDREM